MLFFLLSLKRCCANVDSREEKHAKTVSYSSLTTLCYNSDFRWKKSKYLIATQKLYLFSFIQLQLRSQVVSIEANENHFYLYSIRNTTVSTIWIHFMQQSNAKLRKCFTWKKNLRIRNLVSSISRKCHRRIHWDCTRCFVVYEYISLALHANCWEELLSITSNNKRFVLEMEATNAIWIR